MSYRNFHNAYGSAYGSVYGGGDFQIYESYESKNEKDEKGLLDKCKERVDAFLKDLSELVSIDSGSENKQGLSLVSEILENKLKSIGASVTNINGTIVATIKAKGKSKGNVLLMAHYDTVYPDGEAKRRPFRIDGKRALGPGVADDKGGIVLMLNCLELLSNYSHPQITVLLNPDEEISSPTSAGLIKKLAKENSYVLSFEPVYENGVIVSTRGVAKLNLKVEGKTAHTGQLSGKGLNAALELCHKVVSLENIGNLNKDTSVNWTVLKSGDKSNVIPDKASAIADIRFSDLSELDRIKQQSEQIASISYLKGTKTTVSLELRRPPFPENKGSEYLLSLAQNINNELGLSLSKLNMGFGTDASLAYQMGSLKPSVLEGLGVVGSDLHNESEWMDIPSIPYRMYLVTRLISSL